MLSLLMSDFVISACGSVIACEIRGAASSPAMRPPHTVILKDLQQRIKLHKAELVSELQWLRGGMCPREAKMSHTYITRSFRLYNSAWRRLFVPLRACCFNDWEMNS